MTHGLSPNGLVKQDIFFMMSYNFQKRKTLEAGPMEENDGFVIWIWSMVEKEDVSIGLQARDGF